MAKAATKGKALAKQVSDLKREVEQMRATAPPRPEDVARQSMGNAVDERMAALRGITRRGLEADAERGASSPLGHGKMERKKGR